MTQSPAQELFDKEQFKRDILFNIKYMFRKTLDTASSQEIFQAVSRAVKDRIIDNWMISHKAVEDYDSKVVYYLSMEFLLGRALGNNLINLGFYKEAAEVLQDMGLNINLLEDEEADPALGNGGLGRLAACFLDSLATLGYPAYGCGIRYKYGMFRQKIENGEQTEQPDDWLKHGYPFEIKRPEYAEVIRFGGYVRIEYDPKLGRNRYILDGYQSVMGVPYDIPITGYGNKMVNSLRIWDAEPVVNFNLESFDKGEYYKAVEQENLAKTIVEVLYPNDNHYSGKELRLKQQYFFVSATVQQVIHKFKENHDDIRALPEKVVFQMNDTHPAVAVAELMRILVDEEDLEWDEAWAITTKCCAYTNHTIMAEALEKWPADLFMTLLPRIYQIIAEINRRFTEKIEELYPGQDSKVRSMAIIYEGQVRMANLAIAAGFSVNGVARLHTDILKNYQLADFYQMMPWKFNNKTNGVTQRRFLVHGNPELAKWITARLGTDRWITDFELVEGLAPLAEDSRARKEFQKIKRANKVRLAQYIKEHNGIEVDPDSIFDVQAKRLHEYKRQLLNIMHVMYIYNKLKDDPGMEFHPTTFIFGAKAAAAYKTAKQTIHLINNVAEVINSDPDVNGKLKVVFIENYCVSNAELLFAASDVSEQISTASREASGTGNMKFMMNGAVTIGTMDGANVEIVEEVGEENVFIFGMSAQEVLDQEARGDYFPGDIYRDDPDIRRVMDQMVDGTYSNGDHEMFRELFNSVLYRDSYFVLADFRAYENAQRRVNTAYRDHVGWTKMAMLNTAHSGKFSSDRTIQEYVDDIWHLEKVLPD
ncbi:MAG: glycogen/starch/alpha-glucan phosphorylase [Lachnospiraceae bacterium]|nr:glycogen/starch/alpha-glucan phosphorylase [Lachnospiraceae bacterium]